MTKTEETELLAAPKQVIKQLNCSPPGSQLSRTYQLRDGAGREYRLFLRRNGTFQENFSVGLDLVFTGGELPLVRLNGKHGATIENPHHAGYHSHHPKWVGEDRPGRKLSEVEGETRYASMEEALTVVVNDCTIKGMEAFFPALGQGELGLEF